MDSPQSRWFAEHLQPHEAALRGYLRSHFPTVQDLDDVVQEAFARVLAAHEAHAVDSPKAFLFATARNLALDQCRRRRVVTFEGVAEMDALPVMDDRPGVVETVGRDQELEILTQAIQSLPDRCRQVLTLRKIYALSQKEIAAQLGISEHTVEVQVANGMRRCAAFLAKHGLP